jgi:hypothetical protein
VSIPEFLGFPISTRQISSDTTVSSSPQSLHAFTFSRTAPHSGQRSGVARRS